MRKARGNVHTGLFRAPQYGVWASIPPATDNPAARRPIPAPPSIAARLAALRAEFAARSFA